MKCRIFLMSTLCGLLLVACTEEKSKPASDHAAQAETPAVTHVDYPKGELIQAVPVAAYTSETYALYLPANYTHDKAWPIVFCFDAQGRGDYPLKRYQALADMFQIIFAGSNASRNGVAPAQAQLMADRMIADLKQKLHLDLARMYAAGFSGGARIAALLGQSRPDIAGVLACAAGFQPRGNERFAYAGFVGMEDFNYQEIRQLEMILGQGDQPHLMEYFVGGHDWAPVNFMAKGLQWMHFQAMEVGSMTRSDTVYANMVTKFRYQDEALQRKGTPYQRWLLRKKILVYLADSPEKSAIAEEMQTMSEAPAVKKELLRKNEEATRELGMRQQYSEALATQDIAYWKRVAGMLRKVGRNGRKEDAWLNLRVLNFLSLSCYMQAGQMLNANALDQADRILQIYALVDPPNAEHAYLRAGLRMRQDQKELAVGFLQEAFRLGFEDRQRMQADLVLAPLRTDPRYQKLLAAREGSK